MSKIQHAFASAQGKILKRVCSSVSEDQAIVLIGILYEHQIVLSLETWNSNSLTHQQKTVELLPLEPQRAANLVANLFDYESDHLLVRFQREWANLKRLVVTKELTAAILSDSSVDRLEECSPLV